MALPPTAKAFPDALDPSDQLDFAVSLSQGDLSDTPTPILLKGEGVASYTLGLTTEAVAVGLVIMSEGDRAPKLDGNELIVWLATAEDMQGLSIFDGIGVTVGIVLTVVTTSTPPRRKQRTFLVRIANQ